MRRRTGRRMDRRKMNTQQHLRFKRWSAVAAVAFCGYLTLATSDVSPPSCFDVTKDVVRTFGSDGKSNVRGWQWTAVTETRLTSLQLSIDPVAPLVYLPPSGVDVPVFDANDPRFAVSPATDGSETAQHDVEDGALTTDTTTGSTTDGSSMETSAGPLPPDHVIVAPGRLTLVCGRDASLCERVRFDAEIASTDSRQFTLTASAVHDSCAPKGAVTDLRLEPAAR